MIHMGEQGKRFTKEFKEQIVSLYNMGKTVSQLSSEYGVTRVTIYRWIKEYSPTQDGEISKKEFERMKKELNELRMENEILKKATALFTKKQQKNL